ncbi:hypothetical protein ADK38_03825 [Streptomyces varsoviensis]|uniref:Uncharacterized protein n=1 Tax=Streptomyces varsoviensis TaxID=67373 RepID=A0ABR5JD72_9ACTN|nr:hypothetical protein ADK38_03825 [Streptomyces varsoviensis]
MVPATARAPGRSVIDGAKRMISRTRSKLTIPRTRSRRQTGSAVMGPYRMVSRLAMATMVPTVMPPPMTIVPAQT